MDILYRMVYGLDMLGATPLTCSSTPAHLVTVSAHLTAAWDLGCVSTSTHTVPLIDSVNQIEKVATIYIVL